MTASDKLSSRNQPVLATADTQALAEAFCSWPLPASVCSDPCATMPGYPNRSGTNLITVAEAKAMFDHLVEQGLLATATQYRPISELRDGTVGPVIFWNSCNGPLYQRLVLPEEAQEWREDEVFTHFVLLETDPERREALSASATDVPEGEFKSGDRVRWYNPPLCEGTVLKNNGGRCKVQWDTGEVRRETPDKLRPADTAPASTGTEAQS